MVKKTKCPVCNCELHRFAENIYYCRSDQYNDAHLLFKKKRSSRIELFADDGMITSISIYHIDRCSLIEICHYPLGSYERKVLLTKRIGHCLKLNEAIDVANKMLILL